MCLFVSLQQVWEVTCKLINNWIVTLVHLADWKSGDPLWMRNIRHFWIKFIRKNAFENLSLPPLLRGLVVWYLRGRRCSPGRYSYVSLTDNLAEIAQTLRGPRGLPGQGQRGPPGEPGELGPPGLNSTALKGLLGFSVPHFYFPFLSLAGCITKAILFPVFSSFSVSHFYFPFLWQAALLKQYYILFFLSFSAHSWNFPNLQEVQKNDRSAARGSRQLKNTKLHPLI